MALIELPNGDFISLASVIGIRTSDYFVHGPCVFVDVTTAARALEMKFETIEAARAWARDFAAKVNGHTHVEDGTT